MEQKRMKWVILIITGWLFLRTGGVLAQPSGDTQLQIRLRYSDGTAVMGERIILQRLPEEEPVLPAPRQAPGDKCTTDANGECAWIVGRGLYQVLFTRPLDDISALAVAEGGLRGFGVTVGDTSITYYFTFHSDGRVYFDAAPEAAVPSPIIPVGDVLHGGTAPTPTMTVIEDEPVEETPTPEPTSTPDTSARTTSGSLWHLVLFITSGLVIGSGLHLWSRKRHKTDNKTTRLLDQETKDA
jgi:hypothetical protein